MKTKRNGFLRKLLLMTLAVMMLMSTAAMAGSVKKLKYDSGTKLYIRTYTAKKDGVVRFKLTVKKYGLLDVAGSYQSPSGYTGGVTFAMRDSNRKLLDYYKTNYSKLGTTDNFVRYAVSPGTYYFHVKANKGYRYTMAAGFANTSANSGGASKAQALTLPRGKAATGLISPRSFSQPKWFKFYVSKQNNPVKLTVQLNGGQGRLTVYTAGPGLSKTDVSYLYPDKKRAAYTTLTLSTKVYRNGVYTGRTGPAAGWYYVLVTKDTQNNYKRSSGQFAIKWTY